MLKKKEFIENKYYIIAQNNISVVDNINKKEIEKGGKVSYGIDYTNNSHITILDKDYGKSSELMRALLENGDKSGFNIRKFLFVGVGLIFLIFVFILIFSFIGGEEKTAIKNDTIKVENIKNVLPTTSKIEVPKIEVPKTESPKIEVPKTESPKIETIDSVKKDYQILNMSNNLMQKEEKIKELKEKDINNKLIVGEKEEKIKELEEKIKELEFYKAKIELKGSNIDRDSFYYYLGSAISKKCEKEEDKGNINKCKDIYFNFVKEKKEND